LKGKTFISDGKDHIVGVRYTKSLKKYDLIIDGVIEASHTSSVAAIPDPTENPKFFVRPYVHYFSK
jgi:hypothetical protein